MKNHSRLFVGKVMHARLEPKKHEFGYDTYLHLFDLNELPTIHQQSPLSKHNRFSLYSTYDKDFLEWGSADLHTKVCQQLSQNNITEIPARIEMLTGPKFLGYVFNPVTFYFCYNAENKIFAHLVEINNTFSEKHVYVFASAAGRVQRISLAKKPDTSEYTAKKEFHVSPFYSLDYDYEFSFTRKEKDGAELLDISINLLKDGKKVFISRLWGELKEYNTKNILNVLKVQPFSAVLTMTRITYHAIILYFMKKVPYFTKPNPQSKQTIRADAYSWLDKLCISLVRKSLRHIKEGKFELEYPDGNVEIYGDPSASTYAHIKLNNFKTFRKVICSGAIGFGEAYQAGDWESKDLPATLKFLLNNWDTIPETKVNILKPYRWIESLWHKFRKNTLRGSSKNIRAHYDLSNDFFKLWLDPSMTYSAGVYLSPEDSLEQAQLNKIRLMLDKSRAKPGHKLLEIGSGWGALLLEASKNYHCDVTSLTLSHEQAKLAEERIKKAGMQDKARVLLCDYRNVQGKFDRIVSVEMLEAVGREYLPAFFKRCDELLQDDGVLVLQVITYPDSDYENYCNRSDWIQKHIFPGSHLPSLTELAKVASANGGFTIENIENIGPHYAETLKAWRSKFLEELPAVRALGYSEEFIKTWDYYLASCEAEFETRWLADLQIVFTRPNNLGLSIDYKNQAHKPLLQVLNGSKNT